MNLRSMLYSLFLVPVISVPHSTVDAAPWAAFSMADTYHGWQVRHQDKTYQAVSVTPDRDVRLLVGAGKAEKGPDCSVSHLRLTSDLRTLKVAELNPDVVVKMTSRQVAMVVKGPLEVLRGSDPFVGFLRLDPALVGQYLASLSPEDPGTITISYSNTDSGRQEILQYESAGLALAVKQAEKLCRSEFPL